MNANKVKLSDLKPHPRQDEIFSDLPESDFQLLVEDIRENGLRSPIEITPDFYIVSGHQRCRAAEELGWDEIEAVSVGDLSEDEIELRLVQANLARRQLDPISKARAISAALEIKRRGSRVRFDSSNDQEFRDLMGEHFGMSGRSLDRYLQLLRLPRSLQDAVSSKSVPMTKAIKIEPLSAATHQEIDRRISAGEHPLNVINEYLPDCDPASKSTSRASYGKLIAFLAKHLSVIEEDVESLLDFPMASSNELPILQRCNRLLIRLQEHRESTV